MNARQRRKARRTHKRAEWLAAEAKLRAEGWFQPIAPIVRAEAELRKLAAEHEEPKS